MKKVLPIILLILFGKTLSAQDQPGTTAGKVSYVTAQNVYVKFPSTENIRKGDTLFIAENGVLIPALAVGEISSISCVCVPLNGRKFAVGDELLARQKPGTATVPVSVAPAAVQAGPAGRDTAAAKPVAAKSRQQVISGNVSVSSYLNFSNVSSNSQRMKYTVAMAARNIGGSKLSADIFISFVHKLDNWSEIQNDVFNGLKVYGLSVDYRFNDHHQVWLGRKINPRISNVGAIDGLQYEGRAGAFTFGVIAGTRPDYKNYSFNPDLLQLGGYFGHDYSNRNGSMQTTLAFINQTNSGTTDRRFAYLQHTNALIKNLFFFGSVEFDLYQKTMNPVDTLISPDTTYSTNNSPRLSNLYLSLRYRPVRQLSLSISYSARQNVIYYETYKTIVDRLLDAATVQGFSLQVSYQPVKLLSIGLNAGFRDSKQDPRPTRNIYGYVTYSLVPGIRVAATVSATYLETSYMKGKIFSAGISRDLLAGKLSAGLNYRYVSYDFYSGESSLAQNMGEVNFTWRIMKKLFFGIYYEGTFDKSSNFNRVYINVTQRF